MGKEVSVDEDEYESMQLLLEDMADWLAHKGYINDTPQGKAWWIERRHGFDPRFDGR